MVLSHLRCQMKAFSRIKLMKIFCSLVLFAQSLAILLLINSEATFVESNRNSNRFHLLTYLLILKITFKIKSKEHKFIDRSELWITKLHLTQKGTIIENILQPCDLWAYIGDLMSEFFYLFVYFLFSLIPCALIHHLALFLYLFKEKCNSTLNLQARITQHSF